MNCAERVAGRVNGETVVAAGLFQRRGPGVGHRRPRRRAVRSLHAPPKLTRNLPRQRSLDPNFTDWHPDDMDTWDERIVMVADDEHCVDRQRDWLAENDRG